MKQRFASSTANEKMMKADSLLRKDHQIPSYAEEIQALLKKEASAQLYRQGGGFSVGSTSTTEERGVRRSASATEKTALFSSQLSSSIIGSSPAPLPPAPRTVEEEKSSSAARCLAILGVTPVTSSLPTREEIERSRLMREKEIMNHYENIKRIEEEKANIRPLVWDKPTFCPFGGETKSDDEAVEKSSSNKRKERDLLCTSSAASNNPHKNLFPNYNMGGQLSASSYTYRTEWTKEEVDNFLAFTDKWLLPKEKKIKLDHEDDKSSMSSKTKGQQEICFPGAL